MATRNVDVFIFLNSASESLLVSLNPLYEKLAEMGFSEFDQEAILIHDLPVQFLMVSTNLEAEAVEQALHRKWEGGCLRVMRPEHLAAIAIAVGRPKDRARIVYLIALPDFDRTLFVEILVRHGLDKTWEIWETALGLN